MTIVYMVGAWPAGPFFANLSFMPGVFFPNRPAVHHCGGSTVGDLKNSWGLTCPLEVMKPDSPRSVLGVIQEVCRGGN